MPHPQRTHLWVRHESRSTERRAPLVPHDVRILVEAGFLVTVEESPQRIYPLEEYAAAGAATASTGSWTEAPEDVFVLGIKELPEGPAELHHRHVFFAHAFKGQGDAAFTLSRFRAGGGRLFDIEYLTDSHGKRVVAFGFWAGYVGAALAVLHLADTLEAPLRPMEKAELDDRLDYAGRHGARRMLALLTGAKGRSGHGAQKALATAGVPVSRWDRKETKDLHKQALLGHDLLINCVFSTVPTVPFVTTEDFERERRLQLLADVTCDVTGPANMLPVNTEITTWDEPVRRLHPGGEELLPLDVIAIDNLPSLLPREASDGFSADLVPHLLGLADPAHPTEPWLNAGDAFDFALRGSQ